MKSNIIKSNFVQSNLIGSNTFQSNRATDLQTHQHASHESGGAATTLDHGLHLRTVLSESVMAAFCIFLDHWGYPPTYVEMSAVTDLSPEQVHKGLHLLESQGRLLRSRFGWRPTSQTSSHPLEAIYAYLMIYRRIYDLVPTVDEITTATSLSRSMLQIHLQQLETMGHIHRQGSRRGNIQLHHPDTTIRQMLAKEAKQFLAYESFENPPTGMGFPGVRSTQWDYAEFSSRQERVAYG